MVNNLNKTLENRRYPRFILMLPLEISSPEFSLQTKTKNISSCGFYCAVDRFIPKETEIKVSMKISLTIDRQLIKKTIICSAKVVHIDPPNSRRDVNYNVGIEFSNIRKPVRDLLEKYIQSKNLKEAKELKKIYLKLKQMAARLVEVEECHPTAEHFRKVIERAIDELDNVAHILDFEINEPKNLK